MKNMGLHEIREEFLKFFNGKNHMILPSFSLIPKNDRSLLLINAGMAPLKPYFTGEKVPPNKKVVTCQKCIRTADIENVGLTDRHATFFEMLGNFSFGDYFKKEAIQWSWEFLTKILEIPEENLWVSVYMDDDEAFEIWNKSVGVNTEKIVRLGKEDNFWELEVGPCGPCSEIYVDRGEEYGCNKLNCKPGCDCDRFMEIWNLVFTQYDKDKFGKYHPLENPNIDTGMGLERIAVIMEDAKNIFEIKEIRKILREVEKISGKSYGTDPRINISIRVITDHVRAMTFLVSDGVLPSNEGRGYVLRRLIRRAARHGKLLGIEKPFLQNVVSTFIQSWKVQYPELKRREVQLKNVINAEEEKFQETIDQGIQILEGYIEEMVKNNKKCLNGEKAFKLYDTYGFPLDLTKEILEEKGLTVDENEFNINMEKQRKRARKAREEFSDSGWKNNGSIDLFKGIKTKFKGYETISLKTKIIAISVEGSPVNNIEEGEEGVLVLKETPFYAERGGQVGDIGYIKKDDFKGKVIDTQYTKDETIVHYVRMESGELSVGDTVNAIVDSKNRRDIMRNHSATHLLHRALKDVLGEHVKQAGSIVLPDKLRFDFTHYEALKDEELKMVQNIVNEKILDNIEVRTIETSLKESEYMGAVGLFEDKYKDIVRVVQIGEYSKELCGGTHIDNTGNIGLFKITSESSIASGIRRIEAITGRAAYDYLNKLEYNIIDISNILKTDRKSIVKKIKSITNEIKEKDKQIESLKSKMSLTIAEEVLNQVQDVNGINVIAYRVNDMDINNLRNLGDRIRNDLNSGVIVLASTDNGKLYFISMVTKDLVKRGLHAGNIIKEIAKLTGGRGGGRPDMAQAGGKDLSKVQEALNNVPSVVKRQLK
ncbi:alanine--tRNA ligase [Schnuerera sp. xch1]|uniref:alanine--tRNA ligase n=1 Tax=Schnuerera sp. xch1 TaxID=2874283 RepID=UPI001CBCEAA8|nr:alanine--tRNA ligase [Schnuerera sp. xch1]MBZ2173710.1 alanine--tRNA ligase [Schnuerera sp. xch1]